MIKESMRSLWQSTSSLFSQRAALAIFAGLYVLLLATLYGFIAVREAKIWQVLLTLLFVALIPLLFFLLQAVIINFARNGKIDWAVAWRDSTKLALVTVPVILLGLGIMWLLNRWQRHFPAPQFHAPAFDPSGKPLVVAAPLHRPAVLFAALRALLFGVMLPLLLIHLWLGVAGQNLVVFLREFFSRKAGRILAAALSPKSVLTYAAGLVLFALIPYALLFVRVKIPGNKSEFAVFTARLLLVFFFILLGWLITLTTFSRNSQAAAIEFAKPAAEEIP